MPIRTATLTKRISDNGQALHRARMRREASAADEQPSDTEVALMEERRQLKEEREKRHAQAEQQPRRTALDRLVRTHHAQPKERPTAKKDAHEGKETKKPKARRTRAEKHAEKAAAQEAARHTRKQPAK